MSKEIFLNALLESRTWPSVQAQRILDQINNKLPKKGYVLFSTGYGPSGLPHIGTFGEVVRTAMVQAAFERISTLPTKLICFSDDKDGLRKIPDFLKNMDYEKYLGQSLTAIPDPFHECDSYAHYMNRKLQKFLDDFGFKYSFMSSTEIYKSGLFNETLKTMLHKHQEILDLMLPTLGEERQKTYSPFLPICPKTGVVLQVEIVKLDSTKFTVSYQDPITTEITEVSVLDGHCKIQWKLDFAMRWKSLEVDFEIYGKDHLVNGKLYSEGCRILGGIPPVQTYYELFLDDEGKKISKSKSNGITIEEWLEYANEESLIYLMYTSLTTAKKLYKNIVPKYVDEYLSFFVKYTNALQNLEKSKDEDEYKKIVDGIVKNPLFYINIAKNHDSHRNGLDSYQRVMSYYTKNQEECDFAQAFLDSGINYSLILNLVVACGIESEDIIKKYIIHYIRKYLPTTSKDRKDLPAPTFISNIIKGSIKFCREIYIKNKIDYRVSDLYKKAFTLLNKKLMNIVSNNENEDPQIIQEVLYEVTKELNIDQKDFFVQIYRVILGIDSGPRLGSFFSIYGLQNIVKIIDSKL